MSIVEFIAAVVIAVYAMVAGAFLNASLTAPLNVRKVFLAHHKAISTYLKVSTFSTIPITTAAVGYGFFLDDYSYGHGLVQAMGWVTLANLAFIAIYCFCISIIYIIVPDANYHDDQGR